MGSYRFSREPEVIIISYKDECPCRRAECGEAEEFLPLVEDSKWQFRFGSRLSRFALRRPVAGRLIRVQRVPEHLSRCFILGVSPVRGTLCVLRVHRSPGSSSLVGAGSPVWKPRNAAQVARCQDGG